MNIDETSDKVCASDLHPLLYFHIYFFIFHRTSEAVNTRHRCNNNHIFTSEECLSRGMSKSLDFFIDRCFFFDKGVGRRHVCLWLIVVIVGHKIVHCIVREKLSVFLSELCGESFVVSDDESRLADLSYHIGCGVCLS